MAFDTWLQQWMARHPLKAATPEHQALFTAQVMANVRHAPTPNLAFPDRRSRLVWGWPRWSLAVAAAAGLLVAVAMPRTPAGSRLAQEIAQRAEILAAFANGEPLLANDPDELAVDARYLLLAEDAPSADEASWIEQMSALLDELDEEKAVTTPTNGSEGGWQEELEMLETAEASATS